MIFYLYLSVFRDKSKGYKYENRRKEILYILILCNAACIGIDATGSSQLAGSQMHLNIGTIEIKTLAQSKFKN